MGNLVRQTFITIFSHKWYKARLCAVSCVLLSAYLDDLLKELRRLQLGCSIGGCWYGVCGYADDLIILAPNREVLQRMLTVCETYADSHNLVFSTDPVPAKSKTKCIFFLW